MYNYEMCFFKVWAIFNYIITIFNIIKFHSFFENLTPINPWVFIIICLCIIAIIIKSNTGFANVLKGTFFNYVVDSLKEKNNLFLNYYAAHLENSNYYAIFLLCLLHFGINSIFIYVLLTA